VIGRGHLDAAVTLVDRGADQFKKNKYKQNAATVANARGFGSVVKEFKAEVIRREIIRYKATIDKSKEDFRKKVRSTKITPFSPSSTLRAMGSEDQNS
jgi:hypothetical protein